MLEGFCPISQTAKIDSTPKSPKDLLMHLHDPERKREFLATMGFWAFIFASKVKKNSNPLQILFFPSFILGSFALP